VAASLRWWHALLRRRRGLRVRPVAPLP
jgi:hypothetical protein